MSQDYKDSARPFRKILRESCDAWLTEPQKLEWITNTLSEGSLIMVSKSRDILRQMDGDLWFLRTISYLRSSTLIRQKTEVDYTISELGFDAAVETLLS